MKLLDILFNSAINAFLQVGVFVSIVLFLFGYINYKYDGAFIKFLINHKKLQPLIGALLGLSPGCGGAILVMPLFTKGHISYGTVIATLIATMGDSAFVLISHSIYDFILVSFLSFFIALFVGYLCDYFNIGSKLNLVHASIDEVKEPTTHFKANTISYKFIHGIGYKIFWILSSIGFIFGMIMLMQIDISGTILNTISIIIGLTGTIFSILYMFVDRKILKNDSHTMTEHKISSLKETLIHNASETAFVITWVYVAYVIYEVILLLIGGEMYISTLLCTAGLLSVFIGAFIGLIPGCGPQIIFVTLYAKGLLPFAALLSNAISQDGDALFPLIAMDKKSSIIATIITTIPAILFGCLYYFIFN